MYTIKSRKIVSILLLLGATLVLQSCNLLKILLGSSDKAPTVTLEASSTSAYSDQVVKFTATATDPAGKTLTYAWKVNGNSIDDTTAEIYRYWLSSSTLNPTIEVTVSNGSRATASASVSITIRPAASFRVSNSSGYNVNYIYIFDDSTSTWSGDLLGTSVLATNSMYTIYGMTAGYYGYEVAISSSYYWNTLPSVYLTNNGYYRTFYVNSLTSGYLDLQKNTSIHASGMVTDRIPLSEEIKSNPIFSLAENLSITPIKEDPVLDSNRDESIPFAIYP